MLPPDAATALALRAEVHRARWYARPAARWPTLENMELVKAARLAERNLENAIEALAGTHRLAAAFLLLDYREQQLIADVQDVDERGVHRRTRTIASSWASLLPALSQKIARAKRALMIALSHPSFAAVTPFSPEKEFIVDYAQGWGRRAFHDPELDPRKEHVFAKIADALDIVMYLMENWRYVRQPQLCGRPDVTRLSAEFRAYHLPDCAAPTAPQ